MIQLLSILLIFATAISMFFEQCHDTGDWLRKSVGISDKEYDETKFAWNLIGFIITFSFGFLLVYICNKMG